LLSTFLWSGFPAEPTDDIKWMVIKRYRDELLSRCDWVKLNDAALTDNAKGLWQIYRETLQIIEFSSPNPNLVVFPDAPEVINALPTQVDLEFRANREQIKAEYVATLATLADIENAISPTNAQVIAAVKFMAKTLRLLLKMLARMI